ncbi:DUF917 domain-containing protein [Amnibacterium flavum]|uniref:DUF917 domain-containing protein n=1 Tax=Amnibacterium flavum TaxID=2173173 RepID=A0A2V1HLH4_9MICO|nr:DUF917 domain-containing protein [Amnibacterium flavum]PVZ93295.1 DUF917 domain-containing protein [Amnibacterium flavum]
MYQLTEHDLGDIAIGAALLGTGGGGDPALGRLIAREALRRHGPVTVVTPEELAPDSLVLPVATMGAPTAANEKLPSLEPVEELIRAFADAAGRRPTHLMPIEIGGIAALIPIAIAAQLGLPLVDADMMGRAFPELQMVIPSLAGVSATPMVLADEFANTVVLRSDDNAHTERLARAVCVAMGAAALIALYPVDAEQVLAHTIAGSLSRAADLGALVRNASRDHQDAAAAVAERIEGTVVFEGKVIDLQRRTEGGFTFVRTLLEGTGPSLGRTAEIESQNEHLLIRTADATLATTPDLIIIVDAASGLAVTTEALRYGVRTRVIAAPCDPRYRTEGALAVVGPRAFGYDEDFVSIVDRVKERVA